MITFIEKSGAPLSPTLVGKGETRRPYGTIIVGREGDRVYVRSEAPQRPLAHPLDPQRGGKKRKGVAMTPAVRELMAIVTAVRLKVPLSVRCRGILWTYMNPNP